MDCRRNLATPKRYIKQAKISTDAAIVPPHPASGELRAVKPASCGNRPNPLPRKRNHDQLTLMSPGKDSISTTVCLLKAPSPSNGVADLRQQQIMFYKGLKQKVLIMMCGIRPIA